MTLQPPVQVLSEIPTSDRRGQHSSFAVVGGCICRPSRANRHRWRNVLLSRRYYRGGRWKITIKEIHVGAKPYQRRGGITRVVKIYERRTPLGWQLIRGSVADKYNPELTGENRPV